MRNNILTRSCVAVVILALLAGPMPVAAQEDTTQEEPDAAEEKQDSAQEEKKHDNTGTNPINFTYDARFYMESTWFDGGSLIAPTFEFRLPLGRTMYNLTNQRLGKFNDLGKKYALRLKVRPQQNLNLEDPGGDPTADTNISGMGDTDVRFLAVPYATNKFGIAWGLEAYLPTATNDLLGTGKYTLRPQVFLGFFGLFGKNSIFAPGYLYAFDTGGDSERPRIEQHQFDVYFVWLLAQQKHWLIINPQVNLDQVSDQNIYLVDVELGFSIPQMPGAAIHVRPGAGIGDDKPFDWTFEFGIRFIWR